MTKVFRKWVCRVMVGVVVFAQMSIAAYACPATSGSAKAPLGSTPTVASVLTGLEGMSPGADSLPDPMHPSSPALCAAHCDFGNQSADHASTPTTQPALITTVYFLPALAVPFVPVGVAFDQPDPQSGCSPALAILHCCFRF
jgi:hypothetical protein